MVSFHAPHTTTNSNQPGCRGVPRTESRRSLQTGRAASQAEAGGKGAELCHSGEQVWTPLAGHRPGRAGGRCKLKMLEPRAPEPEEGLASRPRGRKPGRTASGAGSTRVCLQTETCRLTAPDHGSERGSRVDVGATMPREQRPHRASTVGSQDLSPNAGASAPGRNR